MSSTEPPSRVPPRSQSADTKAQREELSSKGKVEKVREVDADEARKQKKWRAAYFEEDQIPDSDSAEERRPSPFDLYSQPQPQAESEEEEESPLSVGQSDMSDVENAIIASPGYSSPPDVSFDMDMDDDDDEATAGALPQSDDFWEDVDFPPDQPKPPSLFQETSDSTLRTGTETQPFQGQPIKGGKKQKGKKGPTSSTEAAPDKKIMDAHKSETRPSAFGAHKPESKEEPKPSPFRAKKPDSKEEPKSSPFGAKKPDSKPEAKPSHFGDKKPDFKEEAKPSPFEAQKRDSKEEPKPFHFGDKKQDSKPEAKPSHLGAQKQDSKPEAKPSQLGAQKQDFKEEAKPSRFGDKKQDFKEEAKPPHSGGKKPEFKETRPEEKKKEASPFGPPGKPTTSAKEKPGKEEYIPGAPLKQSEKKETGTPARAPEQKQTDKWAPPFEKQTGTPTSEPKKKPPSLFEEVAKTAPRGKYFEKEDSRSPGPGREQQKVEKKSARQKAEEEEESVIAQGMGVTPMRPEERGGEGERRGKDKDHLVVEIETSSLPSFPVDIQTTTTTATAQAMTYLHPSTISLFFQMVGTMYVMSTPPGITRTEIVLNNPSYANSRFFGSTITIEKYATAPDSFNITLSGSDDAVTAFRENIPSLMAAFQQGNFAFKVNRLDIEYSTEKPIFRRRSKEEEKGEAGGGDLGERRNK